MYYDEDVILDIRLNILNKFVSHFVICEANFNHNGTKREFQFDINKFSKFKDKIIYIPVEDMPDGGNPYLRENFQRNCIDRGIKNSSPEDLILISDLDEIPNPKMLNKFKSKMRFAVFKQMHFYYKFNMQSTINPFWYGSRICVKKYLKSPQWLRGLKFKKRSFLRIDKWRLNNIIENGGWHFCNLKTPDELLYKYKNLCETNDPYIFNEKIDSKYLDLDEIKKRILSGEDIIGRNEKYNVVDINENFPNFIRENKDKYKNWII